MRYKISFIKLIVVGVSFIFFSVQTLEFSIASKGGKDRNNVKEPLQKSRDFTNLTYYAGSDYVLDSPYSNECGYRYKVNLHAHTTERGKFEPGRDYAYSPKELLESARDYGFDAFAITELPESGGILNDPGIDGILYIPGIEYGGTPHLIGAGISSLTESKDKQEQINHIIDQGGIAYIPHPHFGEYDREMLGEFYNYDGVAVFNSLTWDVAFYKGYESDVIPYNEKIINALLSEDRDIAIMVEEDTKYEAPHNYSHQLNTAWMMVCGDKIPEEIVVKDIIHAVKEKRFTSHARPRRNHPEPPAFTDISINNLNIDVTIDKPSEVEFTVVNGKVKKSFVDVTVASYRASPDDGYVIIRVTFSDSEGLKSWAWSNPIYISHVTNKLD